MKNSCEVCYATLAGYAEFSGVPGRVQTGCPNTPAFKSRYFSLHAPVTAIPHDIQFSKDGNPIMANQSTSLEEGHAAFIISKRVTRNSTLYEATTCVCSTVFNTGTVEPLLIWTSWGSGKASCVIRCPHFRGKFKCILDIAVSLAQKCPYFRVSFKRVLRILFWK